MKTTYFKNNVFIVSISQGHAKTCTNISSNQNVITRFFKIWPTNKVVVVFPFVPVIAIILPLENLKPNSISEIIGIFKVLNFLIIVDEFGIPGLIITSLELIILFKV